MYEWITITAYPWIKALHVIAVISWMAGMLYLPRLFVYHCDAEIGSRQSETFKVMERRLLRAIINPAMIATWVLGLWLAHEGGLFKAGWLHAKFALVIAMSAIHGFNVRWVRALASSGVFGSWGETRIGYVHAKRYLCSIAPRPEVASGHVLMRRVCLLR